MTANLKPFSILVLAPFAPVPESRYKPRPASVSMENPDGAVEAIGPSLYFPLDKEIVPAGYVEFSIRKFGDFHPDRLVLAVPFLRALVEARGYVEKAMAAGENEEEMVRRLAQWPDLRLSFMHAATPRSGGSAGGIVDDILSMVAGPSTPSSGGQDGPRGWLDQIDRALGYTLEQIVRDEDFRRYESAWRGLQLLIDHCDPKRNIEISAAPVSKACLEEALDSLWESCVDAPPSLVLIDLDFDSSPRDLELLEKIAGFAEGVMAPAVVAVREQFFHLDDWDELEKLPYLPNHLEKPVYAKFNRLKTLNSSHWLCITCNDFLLREPYGKDNPVKCSDIQEGRPLWIRPVWALGALMLLSLRRYGMPTRPADDRSVLLSDLALFGPEGQRPQCARLTLSEDRLLQFARCGFLPLQSDGRSQKAWFSQAVTVGGSPLADQLMFSAIIGLTLFFKARSRPDDSPEQIRATLQDGFERFWTEAGYALPEDLEISVFAPEPGAPPVANVAMTPSRDVLPSGRRIEFGFQW